jgi:hypothetical protein
MEILDEYKKVVELLISKINGKYSIVTFLTIDEILMILTVNNIIS